MTTCPICGASASELPKTGDAEGFDCPTHGRFKVSDSILHSEPSKSASRGQWEDALKRAKDQAKPGELPVLTTYDF